MSSLRYVGLAADLASFHVVALVLSMTHGEGLAGQNAVGDNGLEELILAHGGELEADIAEKDAEIDGLLDQYISDLFIGSEGGAVNRKMLFLSLIVLLSIGVFKMLVSFFSNIESERSARVEISFMDHTVNLWHTILKVLWWKEA